MSTNAASNATLVGKSVVIHSSNTTRLTCANFVLTNSTSTSNSTSTGTNSTVGASGTPTAFTGAAAVNVASFGAVAAGLMGLAAYFL